MVRVANVDCVILKKFDLGESDRVLTVFSKELGKISVLAKGVRRITSRKSGSLEVGNHCRLQVYTGKNFYILTEVYLVNSFIALKNKLSTVKYGYYVLELMDKLTVEDQNNQSVFSLLLSILELLTFNPRKLYIRAFELKLLHALGYLTVEGIGLNQGEVAGSEFLDQASLELLLAMQDGSWSEIAKLELTNDQAERIEHFLQFRLERVLEKDVNSLLFFE